MVVFAVTVTRPTLPTRLLIVQVVVLVVSLHGLAAIVESEPRFFTAYLHAGFAEYIGRTGTTHPNLDARFAWPAAFGAFAALAEVSGLRSPVELIRWAPIALELVYALLVWSLAGCFTAGRRARWVAVWLFVLGDWVGQDYLSPQGVNLIVFLAFLVVALRFIGVSTPSDRMRRLRAATRERLGETEPSLLPVGSARVGVALLAVLAVASVVSHQLTPIAITAVALTLRYMGRIRLGALPIAIGTMVVSWLSFAAAPFWIGHMNTLFGGIGSLGSNVDQNIAGRVTGTDARRAVLVLRMSAATGAVVLAAVGHARRWRVGVRQPTLVALAAVPFAVLAAQSYGGEALLRAFLFALPMLAVAGGLAIFPDPGQGPSLRATAAIGVLGVALAPTFLVTRFGNERFERVSSDELASVRWVYSHAPPHAIIVATSRNAPWRYQNLESYHYVPSDDRVLVDADDVVAVASGPTYVLLSTAQTRFGEDMLGLEPGWSEALRAHLLRRGFHSVWRAPDAEVLFDDTSASAAAPA
jgi:hypothetical protein